MFFIAKTFHFPKNFSNINIFDKNTKCNICAFWKCFWESFWVAMINQAESRIECLMLRHCTKASTKGMSYLHTSKGILSRIQELKLIADRMFSVYWALSQSNDSRASLWKSQFSLPETNSIYPTYGKHINRIHV